MMRRQCEWMHTQKKNSMTPSRIVYRILMVQILNQKRSVQRKLVELYTDGGTDAMENIFNSIEFRVKEEIGKDAKPYRSWWNNISPEWKY